MKIFLYQRGYSIIEVPRGAIPEPEVYEGEIMGAEKYTKQVRVNGGEDFSWLSESNRESTERQFASNNDIPIDYYFDGIYNTLFTPPDPHFAVGRCFDENDQVASCESGFTNENVRGRGVIMVNGAIRIINRPYMSEITTKSLNEFWGKTSITSPVIIFDPRVLYNHYTDRFIVMALEGTANDINESYLRLGYSRSATPSLLPDEDGWEADWFLSEVDADSEVGGLTQGAAVKWADYPTTGYDEYNLYVCFNMFETVTPTQALYTKCWIIKNSALAAGDNPVPKVEFRELTDGSAQATTVIPVIRYHEVGATTKHWMVSHNGDTFLFYSISNPQSASTDIDYLAASTPGENQVTVSVTGFQSQSAIKGPQADVNVEIDTGDTRLLDGAMFNNTIVVCGAGKTTAGQVAARIYEFNVDDSGPSTVITEGDIHIIEAPGIFYTYPSVTITPAGDIAVAFHSTSTSTYPSIYTAARVAGNWTEAIEIVPGFGPYTFSPDDTASHTRWGDYAQIMNDPEDFTRVWAIGQYGTANVSEWNTRMFSYRVCDNCTAACPASCNSEYASPCFAGSCACDEGRQFEGFDCPNNCPGFCNAADNHGVCDYFNAQCICNSGWVGEACENADFFLVAIFLAVLLVWVGGVMALCNALKPPPTYFGE